ncbi:primosomal protein N' [Actinotalea sp. BY-33]|uniref:Probable replication restart protein PriA n=1 Tax=Actinotalea soli TaxID=2819234 RepID=A0A939LMN3_9CELL|nr:primosomal protein N' [Actinotalea soli]MBO1750426.1 primosomal protein N' [Actinotalea soli]
MSEGSGTEDQPTLAGLPAPKTRRTRPRATGPLAAARPVASVAIDRPQPHLDHAFDYAVPASLDEAAQPGTRVKVRFGHQDVDGLVLERRDEAEHDGELASLRKVVSAEVVLTPRVRELVDAVARRYAGTRSDVLRLAVPPRHARTEQEAWAAGGQTRTAATAEDRPAAHGQESSPGTRHQSVSTGPVSPWEAYTGGPAFLRRVAAGEAPRAVWTALPSSSGTGWAAELVEVVTAAIAGGRGALLVVPSLADVTVLEQAFEANGLTPWQRGEQGGWVRLVADDGPSARYRAFLACSRGAAQVVIGTRAAAFAPVRDLGLVVCWDEADPLHAEPRAPYPHVREVLALRSTLEGAALLVGGHVRSSVVQRWVAAGWAHPLVAPREVVRRRAPRVRALTSTELAAEGAGAAARLPSAAWRVIRAGLERGPVLVQVPRAGYLPSVACSRCRTLARCSACHGPLAVDERGGPPQCRWCGHLAGAWRCEECGAADLRSVRVGSGRTAEELGRAFPGVPVVSSGAGTTAGVVAAVGPRPALVVATPGAEPRASEGYVAAVLLDAAVVTNRPALDVAEQGLRTWIGAAALVRPAPEGGVVVLVGDGAPVPTQALVRWDPVGLAERELAERTELSLPPAVHMVAVDGPRHAVEGFVKGLALPPEVTVLGPHVHEPSHAGEVDRTPVLDPEQERPVRALVRSPWTLAPQVTAALAAAVATRSARREPGAVRLRVEPTEIL